MVQIVEELLNQSGSVSGVTKSGFGLLELILAIALVGAMAVVVVPNLGMKGFREQREQFITDLNLLTKYAWQQAIVTNKVYKIDFDLMQKEVVVMRASDSVDHEGKPTFESMPYSYLTNKIKIPSQFVVRNFYVESFDEMARRTGSATGGVWFYIIPEGLSQSVIINLVDIKDTIAGKGRAVSLVLNPFTAQFGVYNEFKKPE